MSPSNLRSRKRLLVLLTGICLAGSGSYAAEGGTTTSAHKRVSHPTTHLTPTPPAHPAVKKSVTRGTTSHYVAGKSSLHTSSAYSKNRAAYTTTAHSTQRKGSAAHHVQPHTLTGQQRLAHVHLQPERVEEIQQALIREGYLQGEPTGQWDARTHDAMTRYQTMNGFPATGLPEAKSLMKLGLGSHPLPPELDHGTVGISSPGAAQGDLSATPPSLPVSPSAPPS